ncbi:polymorphic toxin type 37 domain-containing protein [Burkholderia diffusa]|uniref:polymorphic toxin type 37 domain-containing protein n=1 Tax=Burkholderia diffusa TaxID=488732 RepID=UPI001581D2A3
MVDMDQRYYGLHTDHQKMREQQHYTRLSQPLVGVLQHEYDALNQCIATVRPDRHRVRWLAYYRVSRPTRVRRLLPAERSNAYDPDVPKAPGKLGKAEGFCSPKGGDDWVKSPKGWGWRDKKGGVWVPTGPGGDAHGGPHWDVQYPERYDNIYPGGHRR